MSRGVNLLCRNFFLIQLFYYTLNMFSFISSNKENEKNSID